MENRFEQFTTLISKIYRNIFKIKAFEMEELGLKSTHLTCLYYLYKTTEPLTSSDLVVVSLEDKAAISRAVDYLLENNYLTTECKTGKKYKSILELTEKGKNIGKQILIKIDKILVDASVGLSEKDRIQFYNSLHLISNNLNKIAEKFEN